MIDSEDNSLNPLPVADRNSEIQKLSIRAFGNLLPVEKFTFRGELAEDAGVDGSLELKIDGAYTNLRAQIQLKGTDSEQTNQDGSFSVQVKTANLNYLLNGQSPIYVLYIVPRNQLYYVWAREEVRRIELSNPDWKRQKTVSIHFSNLLTVEVIDCIHKQIREEAVMQRKINDILSAASNTENIVFSISPENLEITDPVKAETILLDSGKIIATAGYPEKIGSLAKLLNDEASKSPHILLVRGYAEELLGNYLDAYAFLSKAELRRNELTEDDRQFLDVLKKNCEYLTGRISLSEFSAFLKENENSISGQFKQSYKLNQLGYSVWNIRDPYQLPETVAEISELVDEILADSTASNSFKLYAKSLWIEVEGVETAVGLTRDLMGDEMKVIMGFDSNFDQIVESYLHRIRNWLIDISNAVAEAERLNHRALLASLKLSNALVLFQQISSAYSFALIRRAPLERIVEKDAYKQIVKANVEAGVKLIDEAVLIFQQLGNIEGELRGLMLKADIYEFAGRTEDAKALAQIVLPKAQALQYFRQIESAKDHLAGLGLKAKMNSSTKNLSNKEKREKSAGWSDKHVKFLSAQMVRICNLPQDRIPAMEYEYYSIKRISQEKLDWCEHIELLQDLRHRQSPATMFKYNPGRVGFCNVYGYESLFQNSDFEIILKEFKERFCAKCSSRKPLRIV